MPIIHIVLFEFAKDASQAQIEDASFYVEPTQIECTLLTPRSQACKRMTGLADKCVHPTTNERYFKSYSGGKDNSPEGKQGGFTHGFVCEFQNAEDRDYYVSKDPAHLEFVSSLAGVVVNGQVIDYEPGKF